MQEVLLQLLAPLLSAVVCGFALGWMLWRRGRTFVSQAEYDRLVRAQVADSQPLSPAASAFDIRELDNLRERTRELESDRQQLLGELEARTQHLQELSRVALGADEQLTKREAQLEAARREVSHSEIYIRALEAELRLQPAHR